MNVSYQSGARGYLERAKSQLESGTKASLFYAAFELRCAIESRLQEYLYVQEDVSEKKKKGWKIVDLARQLETVFRLGDRIVQLVFLDKKTGRKVSTYFTPVRKSLRNKGERLGSYLHAMKSFKDDADPWWITTRNFLEDVLKEAYMATAGTLLGPPLKKSGGMLSLKIELGVLPEQDAFFSSCGKAGFNLEMHVDYPKELPEHYLEQLGQVITCAR